MSDKAWKRHERETAKALGGTRLYFAGSTGDVDHGDFAVDVKARQVYSLNVARADLAALAAAAAKGQCTTCGHAAREHYPEGGGAPGGKRHCCEGVFQDECSCSGFRPKLPLVVHRVPGRGRKPQPVVLMRLEDFVQIAADAAFPAVVVKREE